VAGKIKNFLDRDGRYFSRIAVPERLRPFLENKTELRKALGGDRREAIAKHAIEIAVLQMMLGNAERQYRDAATEQPEPVELWSIQEIATDNYLDRLAFDTDLRATTADYARLGLDDHLAALLKRGYSGLLPDGELAVLVVWRLNRYKHLGRTTVQYGTREWRELAMALCRSEYEAMARAAERDEGNFAGQPSADFVISRPVQPQPQEQTPQPAPLAPPALEKPLSLQTLFEEYVTSRKRLGRGTSIEKRWQPVITDLARFLRNDNARKISKTDIVRWRNKKLETLSPKTVKAVYLACIQTLLRWAVENDYLPTNAAEAVKQELPKTIRIREQGYTMPEAVKILNAALRERPLGGSSKETPQSIATSRWVPWLCAFTGARVTEVTQLRREDIRREGDTLVLRLTPDAGTVKTGEYRDVPVHPQIMQMGFGAFVDRQSGPLFYAAQAGKDPLKAAQASGAKLTKWLKKQNLTVTGVAPNHGWRHHFKTFAREAKIADRVIDAITGHASRTAGDGYGDVTLQTRIDAIYSLPHYKVSAPK